MVTFPPIDDRHTTPIHGFASVADYYQRCAFNQFLSNMRVPTLLVQAADEPFLAKSCYPRETAEKSRTL